MQCFYHPDRPALGVCTHCQRGICSECLTVVEDRLACRDRHEEQVRGTNQLLSRNMVQARRMGSGYIRNAIFYGLVGVLFAGFGAMQFRFLGLEAVFFMLIGLFLLYAAGANLLESRKYR
jgi:hypothetical protein